MLKYTVNKNNFHSQLQRIDIDNIEMGNMPFSSSDNDRNLVVIYYSKDINYKFEEEQNIIITNRLDISNNNGLNTSSFSFREEYPILKVNEEKGLFTIYTDRYYDLNLRSITTVTSEEQEVWYFFFNGNGHFFERHSEMTNEEDVIEQIPIVLYIEYQYVNDNNETLNGIIELECSYESPYELSCVYDSTTMGKLKNSVFSLNNEGNYVATISGLKVYRETPFFRRTNNVFVYVDKPLCSINIPLSVNFETNMYQSDMLESRYAEDERNKSINRIVDMEKDVYHPVIWDSSKEDENGYKIGDYVDGINKEVEKIVFNLHFRQHRGEDWLVETDTYWNGCYFDETDEKVKFIDEINGYEDVNFFSYGTDDLNRSSQSDLLRYLNFNNNDVRYQKNKLSRSFIRIMFYDSMNPGNQNLLYYSTIFIDAGKLFGKYIKYIEDTPYSVIIYETDEDTGKEVVNLDDSRKDLIGIKVDREPYGDLLKDDEGVAITDIDEIETLRLSSQFVVQDKYQSNASSDGYYLYLWKDNDNGVIPTDIYMKVEFNHAGFGRTIPFMMPFWDPNKTTYEDENGNEMPKTKDKGIKTFREILDDWNNEQGSDMQYGARKYLKYSYIHFKYKYDKVHKQHIYYLDDEFYGNNVHFEDNVITINLYEAKMI